MNSKRGHRFNYDTKDSDDSFDILNHGRNLKSNITSSSRNRFNPKINQRIDASDSDSSDEYGDIKKKYVSVSDNESYRKKLDGEYKFPKRKNGKGTNNMRENGYTNESKHKDKLRKNKLESSSDDDSSSYKHQNLKKKKIISRQYESDDDSSHSYYKNKGNKISNGHIKNKINSRAYESDDDSSFNRYKKKLQNSDIYLLSSDETDTIETKKSIKKDVKRYQNPKKIQHSKTKGRTKENKRSNLNKKQSNSKQTNKKQSIEIKEEMEIEEEKKVDTEENEESSSEEIGSNWGRMSNKVIKEIIDTDKQYLNSLRILVDNFLNPLEKYSSEINGNEEKMLSKLDFSIIFGHVVVLIRLNENFISELKLEIIKKNDKFFDEKEEEEDTCNVRGEVSDVFNRFFPYFRMYKSYIANLPESNNVVQHLSVNSSRFSTFLKEVDPSVKLTLRDFLIMPMQRIPRYVLLLEQLKSYTPKKDPSYEKILKSLGIFKEIAGTVNSSITEKENFDLMRKMYAQISNYPKNLYGKLIQPHRKFIKEGDLSWTDSLEGPNKPIHLLLFNDVLVLSSKFENRLEYNGQLRLSRSKLEVIKEDSPIIFKIYDEKSYTFSTEDLKWVSTIRSAIENKKENEKNKQRIIKNFTMKKEFIPKLSFNNRKKTKTQN
eukprot:TRINITY_DN17064_c0_g1_i1.p1 TRINITY_DN17064_c0_g1~~TRINITY_DN17064_c0_g1_i1.p1  ORF type:complete len:659 (-),score=203.26 TRINITY_DN17064_c0_g1_i1:151-2127(-)